MERYRSSVDDFILPHIKNTKKSFAEVKLLDIGAGEGYLKYFLPPELPVDGIELQKDRRTVCRKLGYQLWSFDIEKEPFPMSDNHYDIIVASHVIEHLFNTDHTMHELHRILKPGGLLVIGVPMHLAPIAKALRLIERIKPNERFGHHQFYSMGTLKNLVKEFLVVDIRGFRLISSRRRFGWEDHLKFYRFNTSWGKKYPALTPEVNVIAQKPIE